MIRSRLRYRLPVVALLLAFAAPSWAQDLLPVGDETKINLNAVSAQKNPRASFSPGGDVLVVWENVERGILGGYRGVDGLPKGGEITFAANENLPSIPGEGPVTQRRDPAFLFLPNGQILAAWTEERAYLRSAPFFEERIVQRRDVMVQRFTNEGEPVGPRFRANQKDKGFHSQPRLILVQGGAAIVWETTLDNSDQGTTGILARRLRRTGAPVGNEIVVSSSASAVHPALAPVAGGGFLVTWDETFGADEEDVLVLLFDREGAAKESAFRVHSQGVGRQRWPAVAADPRDGGFLVTWQGYLTDRGKARIRGQFLGSDGHLVGDEFLISVDEGTAHLAPAVVATESGFAVAWMAWNDVGLGMTGVLLDTAGRPAGAPFWANERSIIRNYRTGIATDGADRFFLAWESSDFTLHRSAISGRWLEVVK
jgi:hypothetical protein